MRALASLEGQGSEGREVRAGEPVTVEVTATNIGDRPGSEVVQVYRRDLTGLVLRPERELVGFAKVRLEPGDSTLDEIAQTRPGRLVRDVVRKVSVGPQIAAAGPGQADMIERSFAELLLRAAARIGGGMLPWRVVDGVVRLANLTRRRG